MNVSIPFSSNHQPVRRMRTRSVDMILWALSFAGLPAIVFRVGSVIPHPEHYASTATVVLVYFLIVGLTVLRGLPALPGAMVRLTGRPGGWIVIALSVTVFAVLAGLGAAGVMDAWMALRDTALSLGEFPEGLMTNLLLLVMSVVLLLSFDRFLRRLRVSDHRYRRDIECFD
jgi:hypothetical protein